MSSSDVPLPLCNVGRRVLLIKRSINVRVRSARAKNKEEIENVDTREEMGVDE